MYLKAGVAAEADLRILKLDVLDEVCNCPEVVTAVRPTELYLNGRTGEAMSSSAV